MNKKVKVAIFIDWFLPAYKAGGPITSVKNIVNHLKSELDFYIISSDRDLGDDVSFKSINVNKWQEKEGYKIIYLSPENQRIKNYKSLFKSFDFDVIYFNSLFSFRFSILPLLTSKFQKSHSNILMAPRGMLGSGALKIKPFKKKLFLASGKTCVLFKGVIWHATSTGEKDEIINIFGKDSRIRIAQNIPNEYPVDSRVKKKDELNIIFYSRISEKKNLLEALELLENGKIYGKVIFNIVGPVESIEYWNKCKKVIKRIETSNSNIVINVIAAIHPDEANTVFKKNHLFFLPTRHENFGHVIAEALSSSMPVLISDQTPWKKLEKSHAGFDLSLDDKVGFISALNRFVAMEQEEYNRWSQGARRFFEDQINIESIVNETRNVFLSQ